MEEPANLRVVGSLDEGDGRFDVRSASTMKKLAEAEERHFWHASRNRFIEDRLRALGVAPPARVLELGCGGGCVAAHLSRAGYGVVGVEGHASLARRAALRAPAARFIAYDITRGTTALGLAPFDAVGLFDVIEHLDEPRAALEQALSCCRPGGVVVGTVPALRALWSVIDENSGHRLRYERDGLRALCESVRGARLVEVRDFNRALVPLLWIQRRTLRGADRDALSDANLTVPAAPLNLALYALARAEHRAAWLLDRTPLPGASLWFVLRRA